MSQITLPGKNEIIVRGKLTRDQKNRLGRLLDMMYSPEELSVEIGFSPRQVNRVYIPLGCPNELDSKHKIWINGKKFREWYLATYKKPTLRSDEAFCLGCRQAVSMNDPKFMKKNNISYYLCQCPICNRTLARIIAKEGKPQ